MRVKSHHRYWRSLFTDEKQELADKLGVNTGYLRQVFSGSRPASPELSCWIEIATGGIVTRVDLRPDVFGTPPMAVNWRGEATVNDGDDEP